jgi:hypothetical protein
MATTFSLCCAGVLAFSAEAFPLKNSKHNSSVHEISSPATSNMQPHSAGREQQKLLMRGILAAFYSAEFIIGAIIVCILGLNGACCLCPRQDRQRLMKLLEAQKNRRGAAHQGKSLLAMSLASISLALVAAEQGTGKEKSEDASLEAKRALLASIYAGFWSVKIIMGGVVVLVLGIQGACCLCPRSEQSRILALKASLKKIEDEKEAARKASAEKSS